MTTPSWLSGSLRLCIVLLCILVSSSLFLLLLLSLYPLSPWSWPSLHKSFPWYPVFLKRSFTFDCFPLFLCIVHLRRPSYLSLLFFQTLPSVGYIFTFPLIFVSLLSSAICKASSDKHLTSWISFSWGWYWSLTPIQCHKPLSIIFHAPCLPDLIPFMHCTVTKDLIYVIQTGDSRQPCHIPFSILNQSVVPYRILAVVLVPHTGF